MPYVEMDRACLAQHTTALLRDARLILVSNRAPYSHTLPAETRLGIQALLLVQSREAGIAERTAALRHQMRERRAQQARLDAAVADINAAFRTRWHHLSGMAAVCALAALLICLYHAV